QSRRRRCRRPRCECGGGAAWSWSSPQPHAAGRLPRQWSMRRRRSAGGSFRSCVSSPVLERLILLDAPIGCAAMQLADLREDVAAACRRLAADGLVHATAGNVSARAGDLIAITPTGARLEELRADEGAIVDRPG